MDDMWKPYAHMSPSHYAMLSNMLLKGSGFPLMCYYLIAPYLYDKHIN